MKCEPAGIKVKEACDRIHGHVDPHDVECTIADVNVIAVCELNEGTFHFEGFVLWINLNFFIIIMMMVVVVMLFLCAKHGETDSDEGDTQTRVSWTPFTHKVTKSHSNFTHFNVIFCSTVVQLFRSSLDTHTPKTTTGSCDRKPKLLVLICDDARFL
jgi:hypothetical protein